MRSKRRVSQTDRAFTGKAERNCRIIAKAEDDDHAEILRKLGASEIIRPDLDMTNRLARRDLLELLPLEEEYTIMEVDPPAAFIEKSLGDLELRKHYEVYVLAIKTPDVQPLVYVPPEDFVIEEGDVLIMTGKEKDIETIKELK